LSYIVFGTQESGEESLELPPPARPVRLQHSWKIKCHFFNDFILSVDVVVDFVVDEVEVDAEELLGRVLTSILGQKLRQYLKGCNFDQFVAVHGEVKQQVGEDILLVGGDRQQLR
jgi:hypothetical protein